MTSPRRAAPPAAHLVDWLWLPSAVIIGFAVGILIASITGVLP